MQRHFSAAIVSALPLLFVSACGESSFGPATSSQGAQQPGSTSSLASSQTGKATYYSATGGGACSYDPSPNDLMVAAMNMPQYQNSQSCGMCVEVTGPKATIVVRIVDLCPECTSGHLDLSEQAFEKIADKSAGVVPITWTPVACQVTGPISFRFKEGSTQWWMGVQLRNSRLPVKKIELLNGSSWATLEQQSYNYYLAPNMPGPGPFTFRLTSTTDQQITDGGIQLRDAQVVVGNQQF